MEPAPSTVVIVDDPPEVRALLRTQLRLVGDFLVVAEGSDGTDAIELVKEHQPALLILDASMHGLEALPHVSARVADDPCGHIQRLRR